MGKFARLAVGTRHVDYNGRLCMVSAGVAYKLAFGVDRSPIPWSDIPKADVLFIIGSNIGDCSPITTDYVWRCRDRGGKLIVADPRLNPIIAQRRSVSAGAPGDGSRAPDGHAPRDFARWPGEPRIHRGSTPLVLKR